MAITIFNEVEEQAIQISKDAFVYKTVFLGRKTTDLAFVAASSDDSLSYLTLSLKSHPPTLQKQKSLPNAHKELTCVELISEGTEDSSAVFMTGSRQGSVRLWEAPSMKILRDLETGEGNPSSRQPVVSLTYNDALGLIVGGTDTDSDVGDVGVNIWSSKSPSAHPRRILSEIHSNTITSLLFHPTIPTHLLTASTDRTISLTDLAEQDPDSAQLSSTTHAGPVSYLALASLPDTSTPTIVAISDDERLAPYALAPDGLEPLPSTAPDRAALDALAADYTVWLRPGTTPGCVRLCAGANKCMPPHVESADARAPYVVLADVNVRDVGMPRVVARLEGAHGEEVVRDVWVGEGEGVALSGGEDGFVRLWSAQREAGGKVRAGREERKRDKGRHKPY